MVLLVALFHCCYVEMLRFYVTQFYTAFLRRTVLRRVFKSHNFTPRFNVAQFYTAFLRYAVLYYDFI